MPLVSGSSYRSPWWMRGGHAQTILPALCRRAQRVTDQPERLELTDGDFLDLEWGGSGRSGRLAILCHGLEADAGATYIQAMAGALIEQGWDVLAWNYRGCGGQLNRVPRFYHSGATEDLAAVIDHALKQHPGELIDLIGFSLGGNMILKYLGERSRLLQRLHRAVAFSVPCNLACSAATMDTWLNRSFYMRRFLASLGAKIRAKQRVFPDLFDPADLKGIGTFREFDDRFTAPLHGFRDAQDYWASSSSRQFLGKISIPSLLVNAANDPFLGPGCYPVEEAAASEWLHLEIPDCGGHVGFPTGVASASWMGKRVVEFLKG